MVCRGDSINHHKSYSRETWRLLMVFYIFSSSSDSNRWTATLFFPLKWHNKTNSKLIRKVISSIILFHNQCQTMSMSMLSPHHHLFRRVYSLAIVRNTKGKWHTHSRINGPLALSFDIIRITHHLTNRTANFLFSTQTSQISKSYWISSMHFPT